MGSCSDKDAGPEATTGRKSLQAKNSSTAPTSLDAAPHTRPAVTDQQKQQALEADLAKLQLTSKVSAPGPSMAPCNTYVTAISPVVEKSGKIKVYFEIKEIDGVDVSKLELGGVTRMLQGSRRPLTVQFVDPQHQRLVTHEFTEQSLGIRIAELEMDSDDEQEEAQSTQAQTTVTAGEQAGEVNAAKTAKLRLSTGGSAAAAHHEARPTQFFDLRTSMDPMSHVLYYSDHGWSAAKCCNMPIVAVCQTDNGSIVR